MNRIPWGRPASEPDGGWAVVDVETSGFRPGQARIISIAALGAFYLSNRWTLSTIFRRDLASDAALEAWGKHISDMVLASLMA